MSLFFFKAFLSSYAGSWLDGVLFEMLVCLCLAFPPARLSTFCVWCFSISYLPDRLVFLFPLIIFVMGL